MEKIFADHGIILDEETEKKFGDYYRFLVEYNKKVNLTAITEKKDVYIKHFIDSLLCIDEISGGKLLDIGSGGGFPAIPIKLARPDMKITMLEATGKKCAFLRETAEKLGLSGAEVINGRAEELGKDARFREKYDFVTARAVAYFPTLCEYALPFVKQGGLFIAFKGNADEELKCGEKALEILGGKCEKVEKKILDGARRDIIFVRKARATPSQYPRGNGKERKKPL